MCCSLLLMEFFRILMPFFEKLVLSKCWWHFQVKQHLDYLPALVGNTHKRDLHVSVSACILLCSKTHSLEHRLLSAGYNCFIGNLSL